MAPPKRPWFRFYVEAVSDKKLRRQKPETRWLFVACLAAARSSGEPGWLMVADGVPMTRDDLADYAGLTLKQVDVGMDALQDVRVMGFDDDAQAWFVPKWDERQYESDVSTERARRSRVATSMQRPIDVVEASPENREQRTDTEENKSVAATRLSGLTPQQQAEVDRRVSRRRMAGEDIGPPLVALIGEDVVRDFAAQDVPTDTICACGGRFLLGSGWAHAAGCAAA